MIMDNNPQIGGSGFPEWKMGGEMEACRAGRL